VGLNVIPVADNPNKVSITFYIIHTCSPAIRNVKSVIPNANLTAQLLSFINATSTVKTNKDQTRFKFTFELECGNERQRLFIKDNLLSNYYANIKFSNEPSLKELDQFITKLKGTKMVLHAPEKSIFAKHLTSCLTSWNTDISHVPVLSCHAFETPTDPKPPLTPAEPKASPATAQVPSPAIEEEHIHSIPPAFILIDNDIQTLQQKLSEFRSQPPASANVLQAHFGGRRKQTKSLGGIYQNFFHQGTTAIIHFTSLANYKAVRDSIQAFASSPERDPFSMPRIVVVPKPAGPRRFLTALHTAFNNSVVEPHFLAIATAPASPISPMVSMLIQRELAIQNTFPAEISPGRRRPPSGIFSPPSEGGTHYFSTHTSPVQSSPRRRADAEGSDYLTVKTAHTPEPEPKPEPVQEKTEEKAAKTLVRSVSHVKMRKKKKGKNAFANSVSPPINVLIVEGKFSGLGFKHACLLICPLLFTC
jgi:osomolarity two-component system response regulator SSK1